ncbi:Phospholipase SGR2 [Bienertia sinuspersici]
MVNDGVTTNSQNEGNESISETSVGFGAVEEETDPDLLKNTPSNIRRLADEIEQFEGRQKYLAQTRSPSDGGDVRWYFCKVPLGVNLSSHMTPSAGRELTLEWSWTPVS